MKSKYYSTWVQRMAALVVVLLGSISTMLADTKLYIEDFSISAGETKKVAVCLDTDESTIYSVRMTLALPAGLQLVADGNKIKTEIVSERTGALTMESSIANGNIMFSDLMRSSAIDAGKGPIFYVFVKETALVGSGAITISDVELKRQDKTKVDDVVVTGSTVSKNGSAAGGVSVAFDNSEVTMGAGETKTISVSMDNTGKEIQGFQATLVLPDGWTAEVTGPRGAVTYNDATGKIVNMTGINGISGAVLNITLTAPATFVAGSVPVKLTGIKATVNYATVNLSEITSTVNATSSIAEKPTVAFAAEESVIYPGKTASFEVNMTNSGIAVDGFQADLVLPTGWTATVSGIRGEYSYNAGTGRIVNIVGVPGDEGAMFALTLTAPANFEGEANIQLTNMKATINMATVNLDDATLKVLDKHADKETALAALKDEITAATTLLGEADKTVEPGKSLSDAIAAAQGVVETAEADMMVATVEELNAANETLKTAEQAYQDAVKAAEEKAAAKQALTDEITAATTLLGEADKTVEPGKSLNDAIVAAQAVLANEETTTEQYNEAVTTLKAAEEAYDAAVKAAEKAAAKGALTDEVVAATTLLGDADKTVEPGKSLNDAINAAKAVLTSDESTTEQLKDAVETLKAAEDEFTKVVTEEEAVKAANEKLAELKAAAEALKVSDEAKAINNALVNAAVTAAEQAIADANTAIGAVEAVIAEGKLATDNKEKLATAIAAAEKAIADAKTAIATVDETYAGVLAADKLAQEKTAAEALKVSDEAKAYDNDAVKAAVATAEQAIADANTAIAAVEAVIAEGKLATDNKEALATAIAAADKAIADAQTAIATAEEVYNDVKSGDEEAAAAKVANAKLAELKTAAEALKVSDEAKAYDNETVKAAVATAEQAIADANTAIAAVEAVIAEGKLATDNKEKLAAAIAAAEKAVADAKTAVAAAEKAYTDQKAADEQAAAKTALSEEIAKANDLVKDDPAPENEPAKSLKAAIEAAQKVLDATEPAATTKELADATEALKAAENAYTEASAETFPAIVKKAMDGIEEGQVAYVNLNKDFEVNSPVEVPVGKQLVVNGKNNKLTLGAKGNFVLNDGITLKDVNIDATALTQPLVQMNKEPQIASVESGQYVVKNAITIDNVKVTGLTKNLFSDGGKGYAYEQFNINNSVFEYATQTGVVLNLAASMAINFNITNSTFYSKEAGTANFIAMSGKRPWQITGYENETGKLTVANNTFYNVAKSKQFMNTNTLKGQKYLYEFNSNIFANVSNKKIYGNMTNNKKQLTTDGKNTYFFNGEFFDPAFADAANGDFTIGASTAQAKEATGDPRWVVEYVKADFNTLVQNALDAVESGEATLTLIDSYNVTGAVTVPAGKQLTIDGADNTLTLGAETNFSLNDGITLKNVKIDATALTKPLIDIADVPATKAKKADDTDSEYGILSDITLDNVAITALGKSLINNSKGKVLFNKVLVDKSVVEVIGSNAVFALGNGYPADLQINNSTLWSKDGHKGFLFQAHGKAIDINPDYKTSWSIDKSTLYQIAVGKKMNNTNTFKGKNYLVINLSNSILYNVGTSVGNEVNGWLFGQNSTTPTITYANNTYWSTEGAVAGWTDASKAGSDQTGTSLTTDPTFADAANGDFTIGESTKQAREKTGDPRCLTEFVAPTDVDKTALAATITEAEALTAPAESDPEEVKTAWAAVTDALTKGQAVNADANVFQDEVDAANTALADAIAAYNTATGITDINIDNNTVAGEKDVYYNLQGVRVANPGKGIYIKNGKKVLVK